MLPESFSFLLSPSLIVVLVFVGGSISFVLWQYFQKPALVLAPSVPIMGKPDDASFEEAVRMGDQMYSEGVYQIALPTMPHVFFPPKAMKELYASTSASFAAHTSDILLGKYTYQGEENVELKAGIRAMSNNLDVVIKSFEADVSYAFETVFGACDDWVTVDQIWPATFRLAAIMSSRPFLGQELSRDPNWFAAMTDYVQSLSNAVGSLRPVPPVVRFFFESRIPRIRNLVKARDRMEDLMMPVVRKHLDRYLATGRDSKSRRAAAINSDGGELLDWMIPEYPNPVPKKLARDEITIILESVMNISGGLSHSLYNIAKYSEYQAPLREEYQEVMQKTDGLNKAALFNMKKMDSFMKEVHRLNPPSMMAIMRKVVDPNGMQLSVGPRIPCGTLCAVSADRVNMSPEFYPEPNKFDGYRFYRMRQVPGEEFKHQLVSTSDAEINFSFGGRACPGRIFFSALEKVVLSYLLTHYDIRVKPGHETEESRYIDGIRVVINPRAIIQLRKKA
ncbi:cytochrome P450 [Corynespora cassiicola Philippines]|uniref:Cytochrome P450 n=1 Tax=Corynespora cassiicola Philippines TaxID=1448308 RepID=A0A2T2NP14_CORCC|nr:cytochrome P450 [Corynespora cassiicola Philippines]